MQATRSTLFPYTTLFRSKQGGVPIDVLNVGNMHYEEGKKQISSTVSVNEQDISDFKELDKLGVKLDLRKVPNEDRKSTRLNSSHVAISYAVFCLKKKKKK